MKIKKIALVLATAVGVSALAACAGDNKIVFYDYWKTNSETKGEKVSEVLEYDVTFTKSLGLDSLNYTLNYGTGKYVTNLQSVDNTDEYIYKTRLEMPVQYTYDGESSENFLDIVETEVRFYSALKDALKPISSTKTVYSHTPVGEKASSLDDCYVEYNYSITTTYDTQGNGTSCVTYQKTKDTEASEGTPSTFSTLSDKYNYLDNEQLLLALRAIQSSTMSGTIACYNPFLKKTQTIDFSFNSAESSAFSHTLNGEALASSTISYRKASLTLGEKNPGATQTAKIATVSDSASNTNRNVMLSLETPLSYSLGTLVYTLTAVTIQ